jgi:osmoprotectant transport system permease protein
VALGGAYWGLALLAWLVGMDAIARWRPAGGSRRLAQALWWAPLALLLASARLDELSILKEWANRQDALRAAAGQHLTIVAATLAGALGVGVPSAVFVARRHDRAASRGILALLATVQTIPSVALFGLLIAPLAALGALLPGLGIRGVGFAPALVALVLYALLPIVHAVAAALRGIDAGVIEAALGMGMGRRRLLWQVELPLALPALLAAARVAAVQVVGLAVVAALIGAGGFGALVFQGLASAALDLVLLGVLPVVALAVVLDVGLGILGGAVQRWNRR